jgi:hypothetical protein
MSRCDWKSRCLLLILSLLPTAGTAATPSTGGTATPPAGSGVAGWCRAYAPAARPLHRVLDEALQSLGAGWGPDSRGLGYPLHQALLPVAALLPVPEPRLDGHLRQVLLALQSGAEACMKSMPMTTRLRLVEGARALADLEVLLAAASPDCDFDSSGGQTGSRNGAAALTLVVGVEGEGYSLPDTPLASPSSHGTALASGTGGPAGPGGTGGKPTRGAEKTSAKRAPKSPKPSPRPKPHR